MAQAREIGLAAAREAGQIILDGRKGVAPGPAPVSFKGAKDVVTETDVQAETAIISHIEAAFPDHNILGEEGGSRDKGSAYTWVIDPLDGTANYAADLATSCTSIALAHKAADGTESVVLGVVYNPFRDELFVGVRGQGATLNGQPLRVPPIDDLTNAIVDLDLGSKDAYGVTSLTRAAAIRHRVRTMRILGSAVLAMLYVGVGRFHAFYHPTLNPWDTAAALCICLEAGARVTGFDGLPANYRQPDIIVGAPGIYDQFMDALHIAGMTADESRKDWQ